MSVVKLSPAGQLLIARDQRIASIIPEFAVEDSAIGDIGDAKSYRSSFLGSGFQGEVFAVSDTCVAEKVWRHSSPYTRSQDKPEATFDRHLAIRDYWELEKPQTSKLYVPEHYAAVEHQSANGAILMEKSDGYPADLIGAARTGEISRDAVARSIGIEPNRVIDIAKELSALLRHENEFYHSLFQVVPLPDVDSGPRNLLVDYNQAAGEIIRLTAIDL